MSKVSFDKGYHSKCGVTCHRDIKISGKQARHPFKGVCPIIANLVVPSGLAATKSQCDLTVSAEISNVYKLAGHIRCTENDITNNKANFLNPLKDRCCDETAKLCQ
ncbi:hypothetical protein K9N50_02045 [bacterium]|nr:hypothetical protein [bacterium]